MNLTLPEPHGLVSPDLIHPCSINMHELCLLLLLCSRRCRGEWKKFGALCNQGMTFSFVFAGLFYTRITAIGLCRVSKTNRKSSFDILYVINSKEKKGRESEINNSNKNELQPRNTKWRQR